MSLRILNEQNQFIDRSNTEFSLSNGESSVTIKVKNDSNSTLTNVGLYLTVSDIVQNDFTGITPNEMLSRVLDNEVVNIRINNQGEYIRCNNNQGNSFETRIAIAETLDPNSTITLSVKLLFLDTIPDVFTYVGIKVESE